MFYACPLSDYLAVRRSPRQVVIGRWVKYLLDHTVRLKSNLNHFVARVDPLRLPGSGSPDQPPPHLAAPRAVDRTNRWCSSVSQWVALFYWHFCFPCDLSTYQSFMSLSIRRFCWVSVNTKAHQRKALFANLDWIELCVHTLSKQRQIEPICMKLLVRKDANVCKTCVLTKCSMFYMFTYISLEYYSTYQDWFEIVYIWG